MRSTTYLTAAACTAAVLAVTGLSPATAAPASPAAPAAPAAPAKPVAKDAADFNGDGYADLAIGAPRATVNGLKGAGLVSVVYGSPTGLRFDKQQLISRATPGIPGEPHASEGGWGVRATHGDLDADGYDDLLLGTGTGDDLVLWGGKSGISGGITLPRGAGTTESPRTGGAGGGIGDVNGDGKDDLVRAASAAKSPTPFAGVLIQYGPLARATGKPASTLVRNTRAKDGIHVRAVSVGDVTGDGTADIVGAGIAGDDPNGPRSAVVLKGTPTGPVPGGTLKDVAFGVEFGDINADGYRDMVTRSWAVTTPRDSGGIKVHYGGPDGLSKTLPGRRYDQNTAGVPGVNEKYDRFGTDVTLGDVDHDGYADIVVGVPFESGTEATTSGAGAITVLRGSRTGVTTTGAESFTQNSAGIPSTSEKSDHFGQALTLLDADKDGKPELYVGGHGEDDWAGRVWQLQTGATGLTGTGATSFSPGGGYGGAHFGEWFGK
ncbi:integrin alpha pat-2 [Streptomyces sp. NPDC006487]|uniref:integrin alpha pat-2 n=1 Tax=Streptomyces sp. NPDC006487 TaxID=3364748 RepID=UPI0036A6A1E9